MTQLTLDSPVGDWVAQHPRTSRTFEALQIDYCCGGRTPLEQACRERKLDPEQVLGDLEQTLQRRDDEPATDWLNAPLAELCDHIEQTHHAYLRSELPRLATMISKVVNAHRERHPDLPDVQRAFSALAAELVPHMAKEEQVLFPAIRQLEQSGAVPSFPFGTVANPIRMMELEHESAGDALSRIRTLTGDFAVPDDACNTYRATLDGLHDLEQDMHQHVHKEDNILFPRAIGLEGARVGA